jgi:hypothetical protein
LPAIPPATQNFATMGPDLEHLFLTRAGPAIVKENKAILKSS